MTEQSKNFDKHLADEITAMKKGLAIENERERKMRIGKSLILH